MDRALDHLKDMMTEEGWTDAERVDEIRGMTGQNQADAFAKLLREIQDRQEEELQESEAADRKDPSARSTEHRRDSGGAGRKETGGLLDGQSHVYRVLWFDGSCGSAFADIFRDLRSGRELVQNR